jgi:outer membrane protein
MKRAIVLSLGMLMVAPAVQAENLLEVFDRAVTSDPQVREAEALRRATREAKPQALAALLPQVSAAASRTESDTSTTGQFPQEIEQPTGSGNRVVLNFIQANDSKPETDRWSIDLRQSVFSWANWVALKRADKTVAQAEADYQAQEQALISRVGEAYFNVLAAQDNVEAQSTALEAIARQLEQADKRFEVGLIAITDVQEARAARDSAAAGVIAAKRSLASAEEQLREITGENYVTLAKPGDAMPLKTPDPAEEDKWVQLSMEQNLALISSRLAADIARDDVRSAFGGHLPELDLTASRSSTDQTAPINFASGNVGTRINNADDTTYALQFSVPIFNGGAVSSRVRQSEFLWQAARERLVRTSRQTERAARDAYLGVISEISRVNALRQALESNQTALKATEAGYEVGTRTAVDVLDARRNLVQAQTNYARSRYDYMLNVLRLELAAGTLDRETLSEINSWLVVPVPVAPRSTTVEPAPASSPR